MKTATVLSTDAITELTRIQTEIEQNRAEMKEYTGENMSRVGAKWCRSVARERIRNLKRRIAEIKLAR